MYYMFVGKVKFKKLGLFRKLQNKEATNFLSVLHVLNSFLQLAKEPEPEKGTQWRNRDKKRQYRH